MSDFSREFKDKNILVTGGTGSIGSEIVRQLLKCEPKTVRVFARSEDKHFHLKNRLGNGATCVRYISGDIRDKERLNLAMDGIDIVFHAAALKHVPICEDNPFEAVKTNIVGTQNVIDAARAHNVEKVIAISTDKVAEPCNVLGVSKLMAEKLILASYFYQGNKRTKFACVRFGNVLGSNGSILPLLRDQIRHTNEVTVTDPEMTRFVMSIGQAVGLVLNTSKYMQGQEVFILKMPALHIGDLMEATIEHYAPQFGKEPADVKLKVIGARAGEKTHEKLLNDFELNKVMELDGMYVITPQENVWGFEYWKKHPQAKAASLESYSSATAPRLSKSEIKELIKKTDEELHGPILA